MLPPVRTISGSSGSYQNSASVSASAHLTGEPIYPGQAADADRDVNPNHSGKLNVLLLNGRDSVPDGIAKIADALGKALNLPRRDGETASAYVERLALILTVMPAAMKADAEKQLAQILRGVRLQLVIAAFLNPAGPEAARIVALLEMAGRTGGDLATRTVLTSYRQNGGADIPVDPQPAQGPPTREGVYALPQRLDGPGPGRALAVSGPATTGAGAAAAATAGGSASASRPAAEMPGGTAPALPEGAAPEGLLFADDGEDGMGLLPFHQETDNIFSRTSQPEAAGEGAPEPQAETTPVRRAMADLDPARLTRPVPSADGRSAPAAAMPAVADARGLQSVLTAAFAAGDNPDPVIQAKAAIELLDGADAPRPAESAAQVARREFQSRPFVDYGRSVPRTLPRSEEFTPIFGLKGWTEEVAIGMATLPASRAAEAVLAATLVPHAGPEPDHAEAPYHLRGRGVAANDLGEHKAALAAAEQQLIRTADQAAGLIDRWLEAQVKSELSATDQLLATALQLAQDLRQAIPYVSVPYPLADERDDGPADRAGYRASGEEAEEEESREDAEAEARQDGEDEAPADEAAATAEAPSGDGEAGDAAYDLYQRMAGWS